MGVVTDWDEIYDQTKRHYHSSPHDPDTCIAMCGRGRQVGKVFCHQCEYRWSVENQQGRVHPVNWAARAKFDRIYRHETLWRGWV